MRRLAITLSLCRVALRGKTSYGHRVISQNRMQVLVTYDVATSTEGGKRRLRRVAKVCLDYGQRVQNSVFECKLDPAQHVEMKKRLLDIVDLKEDSLRFYLLGKEWDRRVEHHGVKASWNPSGALIV